MDKNNIEILEKDRCTGCGVCVNSCPVNAIKMTTDEEGFIIPEVYDNICTNCGLCSKVCPALNLLKENNSKPEMYAVRASDDIRRVSSSGGVFSVLAEFVLKEGGFVCGAAFDDNMQLNHIMIDNIAELNKLRGSKYLQSNTNIIYKQVKEKLNKSKKVLFVGTPCQVAALKNYVGDNKNLILVDILCHGVPSQTIFNKHLSEISHGKIVKNAYFRNKRFGWSPNTLLVEYFDGSEYVKNKDNGDAFEKGFHTNMTLRKSCSNCPFCEFPRHGDLSIGDFWQIEKIDSSLNDGKGTSIVFANNGIGIHYVSQVLNIFANVKQLEFTDSLPNRIHSLYEPHPKRDRFFNLLKGHTMAASIDMALNNKYDIGIVGIPLHPNFGAALTYYSLYKTLADMNFSCAMFSYPSVTGYKPAIPEKIYTVNPYDPNDLYLYYKNKQAMSTACDFVDTFLVGSDQLFNADLYTEFGEIVTLDWVTDNHRKLAYAASFGHSYFWGDECKRAKMAHYMQKFDAFSVREEDGVSLARHSFGVNAEWVLDPVFLCDKKYYRLLAEKSARKNENAHIFAYLLDSSSEKESILNSVSSRLNLPVELFSEMLYEPTVDMIEAENKKFKTALLQGNINERLYSLINSEFVVTDSFHGVCFAIIFRKPFIAILNSLRGASRFYSILGKLNLLDRLVTSPEELEAKSYLIKEPLDYTEAEKQLNVEIERCLNWLKEAISPQDYCKKAYSTEDLMNDKLKILERLLFFETIKNNALAVNKKLYLISDILKYLQYLILFQDELIIDISVKDTPGFFFTSDMANLFKRLGLKQSLVGKHWQSYIAVLNGKTVVNEQLNGRGDRIAYEGNVNGNSIKSISISYTKGNLSANIINDVDYSENKRGINIVLIDKKTNLVIDSVCFDTHDPKLQCYRFGKRSLVNYISNL